MQHDELTAASIPTAFPGFSFAFYSAPIDRIVNIRSLNLFRLSTRLRFFHDHKFCPSENQFFLMR